MGTRRRRARHQGRDHRHHLIAPLGEQERSGRPVRAPLPGPTGRPVRVDVDQMGLTSTQKRVSLLRLAELLLSWSLIQ
ncbi:hypothetical protein GCM10011609_34200 [Lentzea pudingi]|uniref:Uncharacterized protein n=1 Tax=Lentzea pudingi TaxID=1789439 RepID=A0ABQ2HXS5_9PSEU|nr:hypothetical protein GCM10011609_34200 [Lentzea pudingi]